MNVKSAARYYPAAGDGIASERFNMEWFGAMQGLFPLAFRKIRQSIGGLFLHQD
jgi:hypothetical protein